MNALNASAPASFLEQCDTLRAITAQRPLRPVVSRLYPTIVQKAQQVPRSSCQPSSFCSPRRVTIGQRTVSEMVAHLSSQPLRLRNIVRHLSTTFRLPQFHRLSEQLAQSLPEAMPSTPIGGPSLPTLVSTTSLIERSTCDRPAAAGCLTLDRA